MNTRWRPTPYRDMHVGHIPSAYDCWHVAKASGGRFVMLVDDYCYGQQNLWVQSWSIQHAAERWLEDLKWIGCAPDEVVFSTSNGMAHAEAAERLGLTPTGRCWDSWMPRTIAEPPAMAGGVRRVWQGAAYDEYYLLVKCVDDYAAGVSCFTRGADLLFEAQAYDIMWRRLYPAGLPPAQRYVPTVCIDKDKMSKSGRNAITLRDLREAGYTGEQVLGTMLALLENTTGERVEVPPDVLTTDRVSVIERRLPKSWQTQVDEALKWCGDGQWGVDALLLFGQIERRASTCG